MNDRVSLGTGKELDRIKRYFYAQVILIYSSVAYHQAVLLYRICPAENERKKGEKNGGRILKKKRAQFIKARCRYPCRVFGVTVLSRKTVLPLFLSTLESHISKGQGTGKIDIFIVSLPKLLKLSS